MKLNIVCFRVRALDDAGNGALVADLHEAGDFAPSTTRVAGRLAIRAAIVNHRTSEADIEGLLAAVLHHSPDALKKTQSSSAALDLPAADAVGAIQPLAFAL